MQNRGRGWETYIDFGLIPLVIFFSFYTPYFISGFIFALDEGYHLACINDLLRGSILYRDSYIHHGPLLEYIPYWLMKLIGVHLGVLRGFQMFGNVLSVILAFVLLRTLVSHRLLKYSALYFILRFPMVHPWITRWGGIRWVPGFAGLLLLYLWLRDRKRSHLFFAGALCGLGLLISQEIGLGVAFSASLAIFLRSLEREDDNRFTRSLIQNGSRFFFGLALAVLPAYLYLAAHHAFLDYLKINFIDTLLLLPRKMPYGPPLIALRAILYPSARGVFFASRSFAFYGMTLVFVIIFVWALLNYRKRPRHRMIFFLSLWLYGALALKGATRNLNEGQFNAVLPVIFVTLAMFMEIWLKPGRNSEGETTTNSPEKHHLRRTRLKDIAVLLTVVIAILLAGEPFAFFKKRLSALWWKMTPDLFSELDPNIMPRAEGVWVPWPQARGINGAVRFLREHTSRNDRIFTFPYEAHINFLADRQSASRFNIAIFSSVRGEYMEEVINDLESKQPRFIVYNPEEYKILDIPNEQRIRPIWRYIQANYEFLVAYGDIRILVRKSTEETDRSAEEPTRR